MRLPNALADLDRRVLGSPGVGASAAPASREQVGRPASVTVGAALAVAGWVLLAVWPPMTWQPLVGAGVAAALAALVFARRRVFLWMLLLVVAAKAALDAAEFSQGYVAMPTLMLLADAGAFVLLASSRSRRWRSGPHRRSGIATSTRCGPCPTS